MTAGYWADVVLWVLVWAALGVMARRLINRRGERR